MKSLDIFPEETLIQDSLVTRKCRIERRDGRHQVSSNTLYYEFLPLVTLPENDDAEAYLIALILLGMAEGRTINVHGAVSSTLLSNLTEFRDAWHSVSPRQYQRVDFSADEIRDIYYRRSDDTAVLAFTGGVDSTFSILRHVNKSCGFANKKIISAVFVHGFDIPLEKSLTFNSAFISANKTLQSLDIPLAAVRTNLRKVSWVNWEHQVANAVISSIQQFKGVCSHALLAATMPYRSMIFPLGSNPITDNMLSSPGLNVLHDGAAFSRAEKILAINHSRIAYSNLRVCWENTESSENCSGCEKCIRTILCMRANKIRISSAFRYDEEKVLNFLINLEELKNFSKIEFEQILNLAVSNKVKEKWVTLLQRKLSEIKTIQIVNDAP